LCRPFSDLRLSDIHRPKKTLLDDVAARCNVDTNAIRKQVTRSLEAKAANGKPRGHHVAHGVHASPPPRREIILS
jgi:hypothetical protein